MEIVGIDQFPLITGVEIREEFLQDIIEKIKLRNGSYKDIYNNFHNKNILKLGPFIDNFEPSYRGFRRLDIMFHACKVLNIPFRELQRSIISYKTKRSRIIIHNPKLPIKVSPIFYMLIGHLMGDGGYLRFNHKTTIYCGYRQFNKVLRNSFLDKARYVFGDITFSREYIDNSTKIYLPEVLSLILLNYVNVGIEGFLSRKARVPPPFFDASRNHLVALLTSFIIDEGNVDSGQICISLINRKLLLDLSKLCVLLEYDYTIGKRSPGGMYRLYILMEGLKRYYKNYIQLKKDYPFLTMDYKEEAIRNFALRKKKFWRNYGENVARNQIIKMLRSESLSVKELSYLLQLSRQGIKYHLDFLRREDIVVRVKTRHGFTYNLLRFIRYKEKRKGIGKQYDYTRKRILNILHNQVLSVNEISKKTKIHSNVTRTFLGLLEKENKVKRVGKVKIDMHHYQLMWSLK